MAPGGAGAGTGGGTNGSGITTDFTTNGGYPGGGEFLRAVTNGATGTQATEAGAISTADYWNFVVTPLNGAALDISDLSITGARGGASTPRGFYIESSIDNPNNTWGTKDIFGIGSEQSLRPTTTTYNVSNYTTYL